MSKDFLDFRTSHRRKRYPSIDTHVQAITKGLRQADLLLTTGGMSMGLVRPVIERRFKGTIHFGRVSMMPGKPTTFASIPVVPDKKEHEQGEHMLLFALALGMFHVFVVPVLRRLSGWPVERCQLLCVEVR